MGTADLRKSNLSLLQINLKTAHALQYVFKSFLSLFMAASMTKVVPAQSYESETADIEVCQVHDNIQQEMSIEEIRKLYNISLKSEGLPQATAQRDIFKDSVIIESKAHLHEVFVRSTRFAGGALDYQASRVHNAVQCTSSSSVWFTRCVSPLVI